jgi:long-chain acyl-CoA synthetase
MVMREYWKQPQLTSQMLHGYGFRTGDAGYMDADDYVYLLGRQQDLINVGGRKVVPDEVEDVLCRHENIRDAGCVAISDPDGVLGQCVKAYIVPKADMNRDELMSWLREYLEEYKLPREMAFVDSIPRTGSGKIQRHLLRG